MKRIVLAALLSLPAISASAQNTPNLIFITANSAAIPRPTPFQTVPNTAPTLFNFTRTYVPQMPISDTSLLTQAAFATRVATSYANGWGQTLQTIQHVVTPFKDLVSVSDHRLMQDPVSYLPYPVSLGARFQQSPYVAEQAYYQTQFSGEADNAYARTAIRSNATEGTIVYSYAPGEAYTGSGRGTAMLSVINSSANPIRIFKATDQGALVTTGVYGNGELVGAKTAGQHNKNSIEWKTKSGQLVCKQVALDGQYLNTYYVYNAFGLLEYVLPPKALTAFASNGWTFDSTTIGELCFSYRYDKYGQVTRKGTAGRGYDLYVYDGKRRLVYSQTALQRSRSQWTFSVYDQADRVRFNGTRNGVATQAALQAILSSGTGSTNTQDVDYWTCAGYDDGPYPTTLYNGEINQYNYYDDYTFEAGSPLAGRSFNTSFASDYYSGPSTDPVQPSANANGLLTGTKTRVMNPSSGMNSWLYGAVFYDTKGRML